RFEVTSQSGEDCQSSLAGCLFALLQREVLPDTAQDQRSIRLDRPMSGDEDKIAVFDRCLVDGDRLRRWRQGEMKLLNASFRLTGHCGTSVGGMRLVIPPPVAFGNALYSPR